MVTPGHADSPDAALGGGVSPGATELDSGLPRHGEQLDPGALAMRSRLAGKLFDERRPFPKLGRFEILHVLGRGGLGVVYAARDPKLGRLVALKVLHERDESRRQRRVLREAQTLARLNHPNVVAVYEVGQGDGREDAGAVFIAMEYVEGVTLRERQASPSCEVAEVLALYIAAGRGLHAAHMQGIVHRDFKPANVLVGLDGRARVADFGLAFEPADTLPATLSRNEGAQSEDGAERSTIRAGAGTPRYMAPEQLAGEGVDARSDQFSFCVALYEALFGVFPYDVDQLRGVGKSPTLRAPTRSGPAWARKILQRGLALDPAARFESIDALVGQISRGTQRRRRRYLALGVATAVGVVALGNAALTTQDARCADVGTLLDATWNAPRRAAVSAAMSNRDEAYAGLAARTIVDGFDLYAARWIDARHAACEAGSSSSMSMNSGSVRCLDRARTRFHFAVGFTSDPNGSAAVVAGVDSILGGLVPPQTCLGRLADDVAPPLADPEQLARVQRQIDRADFLRFTASFEESAASAQSAIEEGQAIGSGRLTAHAYLAFGLAQRSSGLYASAVGSLFDALAWAEKSDAAEVTALAWQELTFISTFDLEDSAAAKQRLGMADAVIEGLGSPPRLVALGHQARGEVALLEGQADRALGAFAESVQMFSELPDAAPTDLAAALTRHANACATLGRTEEAAPLYERALRIRRERQGPDHPAVAAIEFGMALDALAVGEPDRAEALLGHVLAVERQSHGDGSVRVAKTTIAQAMVQWSLGEIDEAMEKASAADKILRAAHPRGHSERLSGLLLRASIELEAGLYERSQASYADALREVEAGDTADEAELRNNLGWLAGVLGDPEAAAAHALRALELIGPDDPRWPYPVVILGDAYVTQERWTDARVLLERGLSAAQKLPPDTDPALITELQWQLALALAGAQIEPDRARELAQAALQNVDTLQRGAEAKAELGPLVDERSRG